MDNIIVDHNITRKNNSLKNINKYNYLDIYSNNSNYLTENIINSMKRFTMNQIAVNKKRITVQLDYFGEHDNLCPICLVDMNRKSVKHIPCGHTFHMSCLNKLLNSNTAYSNKCPCCREIITPRIVRHQIIPNYYLHYYDDNQSIRIPIRMTYDQNDLSDEIVNGLMHNILQNALEYIHLLRRGENMEINFDVSLLNQETELQDTNIYNDNDNHNDNDNDNGEFLLGDLIYDL